MRGFVYSFAAAAALFLAMQLPPVEAVVGFFGAMPIALLALPLVFLPHVVAYGIIAFAPPALGIAAHFRFRPGDRAFRDSVFTILSGLWLVYALGVFHFLCLFQYGGGSGSKVACSGLLPNF